MVATVPCYGRARGSMIQAEEEKCYLDRASFEVRVDDMAKSKIEVRWTRQACGTEESKSKEVLSIAGPRFVEGQWNVETRLKDEGEEWG